MTDVGLVGMGVIGRIYAVNLLKAYQQIRVYDLDQEKAGALADRGARPVETARALAEASDVIIMALPSPEAVESVMSGPKGLLSGVRSGAIIVDLSTIDPDTSIRMYGLARDKGVAYLDAPISGGAPQSAGTDGARNANVTFMVSGDEDAFERARPVMESLGKEFFYLGPSGMGTIVKLLSNLVSGLINLVCAEAFVLGAAAGIKPETLLEVFDETDANSYFLKDYISPRIKGRDFEPGFSVDLMYKDHRLAGELAKRLGIPLPLNDLATQIYQMQRAQGLGQKDLVEAVRFWGRVSGVDIYQPRETYQGRS